MPTSPNLTSSPSSWQKLPKLSERRQRASATFSTYQPSLFGMRPPSCSTILASSVIVHLL